jgi:hypothetical protein
MRLDGSGEAGGEISARMARLDQQLTSYRHKQTRLIGILRMINSGMGHPSTYSDGLGLPVATLEVPSRATKRDYNYFDELQAALSALSARERSNGGAPGDLGAG